MIRQKSNKKHNPIAPRSVKIRENYYYKTIISDVTRANEIRLPEGRIEFTVSNYEIKNYLGKSFQTVFEYFSNLRAVILEEKIDGILTVENYIYTNIDEIVLSNRNEGIPLVEAVLASCDDNQLRNISIDNDWRAELKYKPELPGRIEIYMQAGISDENIVPEDFRESEYFESSKYYNEGENDVTQEVAQQISRQVGLDNSLIIEFWLELRFPHHIKTFLSHPPIISHAKLQWPFSSPRRFLKFYIDNKSVDNLYFNPESSSLEWFEVPFIDSTKDPKLNLVTPRMRIEIFEPIEFYNLTTLNGYLQIDMPYLISGLDLIMAQQNGDEYLDIASHVNLDFEMHLDDIFARKRFSPYQHIQFPNVPLTEMRVADIILLLQDMRFKLENDPIREEKRIEKQEQEKIIIKQFSIIAKRKEAGSELILWILVEGRPSGTTRERIIPGEEKFITKYPTGSTIVYIRGELEGDNQRVVGVINDIHRKLKKRFRHVKLME